MGGAGLGDEMKQVRRSGLLKMLRIERTGSQGNVGSKTSCKLEMRERGSSNVHARSKRRFEVSANTVWLCGCER